MNAMLGMLAATATLVSSAAMANDYYIGAHGEFLWPEESDTTLNGTPIGTLEYDLEYAAVAKVGIVPSAWRSSMGAWRFDAEWHYREADFDDLVSSMTPGGFGGSMESHALMVNAYYDVDTGMALAPYIGGGVGYASHQYDTQTLNIDDTEGDFAYQGMVGLSYAPLDLPSWTFNLGYRYFTTEDIKVTTANGGRFEHEFETHSVEYGVRYNF